MRQRHEKRRDQDHRHLDTEQDQSQAALAFEAIQKRMVLMSPPQGVQHLTQQKKIIGQPNQIQILTQASRVLELRRKLEDGPPSIREDEFGKVLFTIFKVEILT